MVLSPTDRDALMGVLEAMPDFLAERFAGLSAAETVTRGPGDTFAPVEQCWHLFDLEREGFGARLRRLLEEDEPFLPDFDGARIARERDYASRSLAAGLAAFAEARASNLAAFRTVHGEQWSRVGTQEGVGPVAVCDLPSMMAEHDVSHRSGIEAWLDSVGTR
jgi:hypothetical protein